MRLLVLGASALALFGLIACTPGIPDTIKIGAAQPLSGPYAHLGNDMLKGAQLAANEINASGTKIDGKTVHIEIVPVDDRADADVGETVAHQLVEAGIVAVIGHLNSGVSIRTAPVYAESGVPQLSISTQPRFTQMGFPTTLRLVASDTIQARAMGSYAATLSESGAYAVLDDNSSYGKALADQAFRSLTEKGKNVSLRRSIDERSIDLAPLIEDLQAARAAVIVTTLSDFQVSALIDRMAKSGLQHVKIVGADVIKTDKLLARKLPLEVFATSPVLEPLQFGKGRKFVDAFAKANGNGPVYGAHYAYDAVHLLIAAIRRTGSVDRRKVTAALHDLGFNAPVNYTMKFGPDGEQLYGSVGVYRPRDGRWEPLIASDSW